MNELAAPPKDLRLATSDEVSDALTHALWFNGRTRSRDADEIQARITAGHPLRCLEMSGFVLMRRPPQQEHSSADFGPHLPSPYPLSD
jgi:hypothetical protein